MQLESHKSQQLTQDCHSHAVFQQLYIEMCCICYNVMYVCMCICYGAIHSHALTSFEAIWSTELKAG